MLDFYLEPYLPKVAKLGKPILIVDGFAGPGRFKDGELGSPLIICEQVAKRIEAGCSVPIEVLCVESDSELFADLADSVGGYLFAQARHQTFLESVDEIEQLAKDHTVFLYLDPFAITGLEWASLDRVFRFLDAHRSIEILLNLNGSALGRTARQALGITAPAEADDLHDASIPGDGGTNLVDRVVGDSSWRDVVNGTLDFPTEVDRLVEGYARRLGGRFAEVCRHDIKEAWLHKLPKYTLLFASRHPDAVVLMNDAAVKSRGLWAASTAPDFPTLFETRPEDVVPDPSKAQSLILESAQDWIPRGELKRRIMRERFGLWRESQIRGQIETLLKQGVLTSESGDIRINDTVRVRRRCD